MQSGAGMRRPLRKVRTRCLGKGFVGYGHPRRMTKFPGTGIEEGAHPTLTAGNLRPFVVRSSLNDWLETVR